jgi:hypothetical protein
MSSEIIIEDYSEKAIVIRGEKTKEIKEILMDKGGKYNAKLKCGAGWIFPKTKDKIMRDFIKNYLANDKQVSNVTNPKKEDKKEVRESSKNEDDSTEEIQVVQPRLLRKRQNNNSENPQNNIQSNSYSNNVQSNSYSNNLQSNKIETILQEINKLILKINKLQDSFDKVSIEISFIKSYLNKENKNKTSLTEDDSESENDTQDKFKLLEKQFDEENDESDEEIEMSNTNSLKRVVSEISDE